MIEQCVTASEVALLDEDARLETEIIRLRYRQVEVRAELNARNAPATLGYPGLAQLLAARLRYSPLQARRQAQAVARFGARRALTGEALEPVLPATAKALSVGEIGFEHAAEIAGAVEAIPAADRAEHAAAVETALLEHARTVDPRTVKLLGQRILAHL